MLAGSAGQPRSSHANISPDRQQDGEKIPASEAESQAESSRGIKLYAHVQTCQALGPNEDKVAGSPTRYRAGTWSRKMQGLATDLRSTDPASTAREPHGMHRIV
jgi:hypothetical protein